MSVVVRMEMPEGCWNCPCVNGEYGYCQADKDERQIEDPNERPSWCPILCALPEGHGPIVDFDCVGVGYTDEPYIEPEDIIVPAERSEI